MRYIHNLIGLIGSLGESMVTGLRLDFGKIGGWERGH